MSDRTVRSTGRGTPGRRWRATAAVTVMTGAMALAGCGSQVFGAQPSQTTAGATKALAVAANSGCLQARPVTDHALGVLHRLRRGTLAAASAQRLLAAGQAGLGRLIRTTSDTVLQENLAEAFDAFSAFRAVMLSRHAPAYQQTFTNLAGMLAGFRRVCPVGNPDFTTGIHGWVAASGSTALTRSAIAHGGRWSLQVTNAGKSAATAGFTDSPSWVPSTLKGPEQIGLWARALGGTPVVTLTVRELSGGTVVGGRQVTMRLDSSFRFGYLTYQVRRPGASRLSVTVSAANLAPGEAFLVDDVTIARD